MRHTTVGIAGLLLLCRIMVAQEQPHVAMNTAIRLTASSEPAHKKMSSTKAPHAVNTKKGLGIYPEMLGYDPARKLNIAWYYNWTAKPTAEIPGSVEFVPMVFGWYGDKDGKTSKEIADLRETLGARHLLGYNEPDGNDQAALAVDKGLDAWPVLMKAGLPLGSPAAVHAEDTWMQSFMAGAKAHHYRVDFVTVHWYYLTHPDSFLGYLKKIHDLYKKPLWITEFANVDWDQPKGQTTKFTAHDVAEFLRAVLPRLNKLAYVQRYAWFNAQDDPYATSSLFKKDGSLTEPGEVYASY
jgi:hypothetical protein